MSYIWLIIFVVLIVLVSLVHKFELLVGSRKEHYQTNESCEHDYSWRYYYDDKFETPAREFNTPEYNNVDWWEDPKCYDENKGEKELLYKRQEKNECSKDLGALVIADANPKPIVRPKCPRRCTGSDFTTKYYNDPGETIEDTSMNESRWNSRTFCGTKYRKRVKNQQSADKSNERYCEGDDPTPLSGQNTATSLPCCTETPWSIRYYKTKWASPVDGEPPCETTYYGRKERATCKESSGENGPTTDETNVPPKVNSTTCCVPTEDWHIDPSSSGTCYQSNGSQQYCGTGYHREIRTEGCGGPTERYSNMSCNTGKVCDQPEAIGDCERPPTTPCEKHPTEPRGVYTGLQQYQYYSINSPTAITGEPQSCEASCDDYDQDCVMSGWVNIEGETCTKKCGGGDINQERTVLTKKHGNGRACSSQLTRTVKCNNQPCKVYTISLDPYTNFEPRPQTGVTVNMFFTFTHLYNTDDPTIASEYVTKKYWFDKNNFIIQDVNTGQKTIKQKCAPLPLSGYHQGITNEEIISRKQCYTLRDVDLTKPVIVERESHMRNGSIRKHKFTFNNVTAKPKFFEYIPYGSHIEGFGGTLSGRDFSIFGDRVIDPNSIYFNISSRYSRSTRFNAKIKNVDFSGNYETNY